MRKQFAQQSRVRFPFQGQLTVTVHRDTSIGRSVDEAIQHHIGRAGIERENAAPFPSTRNIGDVADPAQIDDQSRAPWMSQEQGMNCRRQRRALPSSRHITRTKVRHGGDSRPFGNDRRFRYLKR